MQKTRLARVAAVPKAAVAVSQILWRVAAWRGLGIARSAHRAADAPYAPCAQPARRICNTATAAFGTRDAREPHFLHPELANEVEGPARTLLAAARALAGRWGLRLTIRA